MSPTDIKRLDHLICGGHCFAVDRLPGASEPRFMMQEGGDPQLLHTAHELNGRSGFVMAPFAVSCEHPIVVIRPDLDRIPDMNDGPATPATSPSVPLRGLEDGYSEAFARFMAPLREGYLDKLVLSSHAVMQRPDDFSPAAAFDAACALYPDSYVYLCHTPTTGTWLGSTPEVLLAGTGTRWHTVALAGTRPLASARWDDKNIQEQAVVVRYIRDRLQSFGLNAEEKGPYSSPSAGLVHLKTDFRFTIRDNTLLGDLVELLHPTPAVCGLPREKARRFILEHEDYDRQYYTGFAGRLDPGAQSGLFVNLRCMKVTDDRLVLYAGGGLMPMSSEEEELGELRDKLQTMLALIGGEADVFR